MIPADVEAYLRRSFVDDEVEQAIALLDAAVTHTGAPAQPRLQRCAVIACNGSLSRLKHQIDTLAIDYRDVIVAAEYSMRDGELVRTRNLEREIPD
jgi:hypothetical protein